MAIHTALHAVDAPQQWKGTDSFLARAWMDLRGATPSEKRHHTPPTGEAGELCGAPGDGSPLVTPHSHYAVSGSETYCSQDLPHVAARSPQCSSFCPSF